MTVTYSPTSGICVKAWPMYRGAPVRRDALDLHASCGGLYDGIGPVGPYGPGCPCMCECHSPEGLPDWKKPQEGAALEEAWATERRIREVTAHLEQAHPVLGPGRLVDVVRHLKETCPECEDSLGQFETEGDGP